MQITNGHQPQSGVTTLMYVGDDPIAQASSKLRTLVVVGGIALGIMWLLGKKKR